MHVSAMIHPVLRFTYSRRHPGSTRAGNIGFYTFIGVTVVALLVLLGIYMLAQDALKGVAAVVQPAMS